MALGEVSQVEDRPAIKCFFVKHKWKTFMLSLCCAFIEGYTFGMGGLVHITRKLQTVMELKINYGVMR